MPSAFVVVASHSPSILATASLYVCVCVCMLDSVLGLAFGLECTCNMLVVNLFINSMVFILHGTSVLSYVNSFSPFFNYQYQN